MLRLALTEHAGRKIILLLFGRLKRTPRYAYRGVLDVVADLVK